MTMEEILWRIAHIASEGLIRDAQTVHQMAGEHGWMDVIIFLVIYLAVLCGLSSLSGLT